MLRTLCLSCLIALSGCTKVKPIKTADGKDGFVIECQNISDCTQAAGQNCPRGYDMLDKTSQEVPVAGSPTGATMPFYTWTVQCRDALATK